MALDFTVVIVVRQDLGTMSRMTFLKKSMRRLLGHRRTMSFDVRAWIIVSKPFSCFNVRGRTFDKAWRLTVSRFLAGYQLLSARQFYRTLLQGDSFMVFPSLSGTET